MSFTRYPEYRESEVDWLGEIPAAWDVAKLRHIFRESGEKIDDEVVGPMLSVSGYRGIEVKDYEDDNQRRSDEDLIGYRIVRPGQLVVNTMWLNYAGLGVSEHEGHVSPAYRSYWIEADVDPRYIHHLMRSSIYVQGYTQLLTGIRPNSLQMSRDNLMGFPVLLPPRQDQKAIATFLDRETAKIDALVAEQERLIALLKEKRQAVISHAVTKGLDPDAPMKDSGIEWLGEIPAHWGVAPVKYCARIGNGSTPSKDDMRYWEDGSFPWLNSSVVNSAIVDSSANFVTDTALKECHLPVLSPPAVLMAITGQGKTRGMVSILAIDATISQHVAYIKPDETRLTTTFCARWFESLYTKLRADSDGVGSTKGAITCDQISREYVVLPPVHEQTSIVEHLRGKVGELDALGTDAAEAIKLLNERRAALISATVTGKIDVRGLVEQHEMEAA